MEDIEPSSLISKWANSQVGVPLPIVTVITIVQFLLVDTATFHIYFVPKREFAFLLLGNYMISLETTVSNSNKVTYLAHTTKYVHSVTLKILSL